MNSSVRHFAMKLSLLMVPLFWGCSQDTVHLDAVGTIEESSWQIQPAPALESGHVLFVSETQGHFPDAMAVARVRGGAASGDEKGKSEPRWTIWNLKTEEAAYWNMLMSDVSSVREIFTLSGRSTHPDTWLQEDLAHMAAERNAGLCLLYGVTSDDPQSYRMSALLIEAATGRKLALIRATATPEDFQLPSPDRHHTDLRHRDPSFLCEQKLQANVRACLLAMMARDKPAATQPSTWQNARPIPLPQPVIVVPH